jgi:hypothetical protein
MEASKKPSNRKSVGKLFSEKIKLRHKTRRVNKLLAISKLPRKATMKQKRYLPPNFPYQNQLVLLTHAENTDTTFTLPPNTEVVFFTLAGRPLYETTAYSLINTLRDKYEYYKGRNLDYLHNKFYTAGDFTIQARIFRNETQCPNFPIQIANDILEPVQKIFDAEHGRIERDIDDNNEYYYTRIEGINESLSEGLLNSLQMNHNNIRNTNLEECVTFIRSNTLGSLRLFYLGCMEGGEYRMEEEPEKLFKNFSLQNQNIVMGGLDNENIVMGGLDNEKNTMSHKSF